MFSPLWQNQRTALNYYNGYVYFAYSAHGDISSWHGWLFAYNATSLQQSAALCLTPNDIGGGVWGSGAGMPIDTNISGGRMFVVTGNGARSNPPFNASTEFGESVIAFNLANGALTPTDSFTSFNYLNLNTEDWDQGCRWRVDVARPAGCQPTHPDHRWQGRANHSVRNRDNLGGLSRPAHPSNTNALQDISGLVRRGKDFWGTAAYWNGKFMCGPAATTPAHPTSPCSSR